MRGGPSGVVGPDRASLGASHNNPSNASLIGIAGPVKCAFVRLRATQGGDPASDADTVAEAETARAGNAADKWGANRLHSRIPPMHFGTFGAFY